MSEEEKYKQELIANGVDIPGEAKEDAEAKAKEEADAKAKAALDAKAAEDAKANEHLQDKPKDERKPRSIYDEYKDKKAELKTEKELREIAEKENADLKVKVAAFEVAKTPEEKKDAKDDLEKFAEEIKADPVALKKMRDLFTKDITVQGLSEEDRNTLNELKQFKAQNQQVIEQQMFDKEFTETTPKLKELFPNIAPESMDALKTELDKLSHTKDWHDKSLHYIAFENRDKLSAIVTPKKRGMEGKGKHDNQDASGDFDPYADFSKMTAKEREVWEANYNKLMSRDGLLTDSQGRKLII